MCVRNRRAQADERGAGPGEQGSNGDQSLAARKRVNEISIPVGPRSDRGGGIEKLASRKCTMEMAGRPVG